MEWNTNKTTLFIKEYRSSPELWNAKSAEYKDRNVKNDKLKLLANKFECSVSEIKKKIKNLRSAFHREHKRISKPKPSPKKEKWFAYNLLTFLLDVNIPRQTFQSIAENSEEEDDATNDDTTNEDTTNDDETNLSSCEGSVKQFISPKKRPKRSKPASPYTKREEEAYALLQKAMKKDEFTTYGEHVANELRDLQPRARTITKHLINNILFEAAMGKYNNDGSSEENMTTVTQNQITSDCEDEPVGSEFTPITEIF